VKRSLPKLKVAIARFRFTAWAKYPDWQWDDAIAPQVARKLNYEIIPARFGEREVVLEGGSIDVNGSGTVVTTEECLLDTKVQVRNPGMSRADVERALQDNLGVTNVVWLGKGVAGDDTHGHVDDLCRFVDAKTVVMIREKTSRDENYKPLEENWERLSSARLEDGSKINAVALPMPAPLRFDGVRLPASYANFYITNSAVLVPTFNDPNDRVALGILGELFPSRSVLGIHAVDLVWGFGTLHCLTQQQPAL
jgi:agmatine deiminase